MGYDFIVKLAKSSKCTLCVLEALKTWWKICFYTQDLISMNLAATECLKKLDNKNCENKQDLLDILNEICDYSELIGKICLNGHYEILRKNGVKKIACWLGRNMQIIPLKSEKTMRALLSKIAKKFNLQYGTVFLKSIFIKNSLILKA